MSKIGQKPVLIPAGVTVVIDGRNLTVTGPKGTLSLLVRQEAKVTVGETEVIVERKSESKIAKSMHGLVRSLIANMVTGVSDKWTKELELIGVGYRANVSGNKLALSLGFSHPVEFIAPEGIEFATVENKVIVTGIDKTLVGQIAADIRKKRPPEPYKGKGIRYVGEHVRRKSGKAAKAAA